SLQDQPALDGQPEEVRELAVDIRIRGNEEDGRLVHFSGSVKVVLVDQPAEDIATKNARCTRESGGIEAGRHGWGLGGIKPERAMRAGPVVVGNVLGEH